MPWSGAVAEKQRRRRPVAAAVVAVAVAVAVAAAAAAAVAFVALLAVVDALVLAGAVALRRALLGVAVFAARVASVYGSSGRGRASIVVVVAGIRKLILQHQLHAIPNG